MGSTPRCLQLCDSCCQPPCPSKACLQDACYGTTQMVFQHCFSCHRQRKMAENSPRTQGFLLPLLDFVIVLQAQLPVGQSTMALPKLQPKLWAIHQHSCRPQRSHPRCQLHTSPKLHRSKILHTHGPPTMPVDSPHYQPR